MIELSGCRRTLQCLLFRAFSPSGHQMAFQTLRTATENRPIILMDEVFDDPDGLVDYAASLAPFPAAEGNFYPGLRRLMAPAEANALMVSYVTGVAQALANIMGPLYGIRRLFVRDVAFSIVTTPPSELQPLQSLPHIDSTDPMLFAALHYLSHHEKSGTAFFRHERTGLETITRERLALYTGAREQEEAIHGRAAGYIKGSSHGFAEVARVEARFNRLAAYPGNLLHSGILPDDYDFDPDPRRGRLTANIFLTGQR